MYFSPPPHEPVALPVDFDEHRGELRSRKPVIRDEPRMTACAAQRDLRFPVRPYDVNVRRPMVVRVDDYPQAPNPEYGRHDDDIQTLGFRQCVRRVGTSAPAARGDAHAFLTKMRPNALANVGMPGRLAGRREKSPRARPTAGWLSCGRTAGGRMRIAVYPPTAPPGAGRLGSPRPGPGRAGSASAARRRSPRACSWREPRLSAGSRRADRLWPPA